MRLSMSHVLYIVNEQAVNGKLTTSGLCITIMFGISIDRRLLSPHLCILYPGFRPLVDRRSAQRTGITKVCKASEFKRTTSGIPYSRTFPSTYSYRVSLALLRLARIEMNNSIKLL